MTITYNQLERAGRCGNQLFQVASTVGIAHTRGEDVALPPNWSYRPFLSCPDEWFGRKRGTESWQTAQVDHIDPRARLYLQDVSLFADIADVIRDAFQPNERAAAAHLGWNLKWDEAIAVHVRRGDLLTQEQGFQPALTVDAPDYYRTALDMLDPMAARHVVVFSDDPAWCEANQAEVFGRTVDVWFGGEPRSHILREYRRQEPRDWIDMMLMSCFDSIVMSNSTYAVWAAWLSTAEVLYPSLWFGSKLDYIDHRLMIPSGRGWREVPCAS